MDYNKLIMGYNKSNFKKKIKIGVHVPVRTIFIASMTLKTFFQVLLLFNKRTVE